jgi:hypothetical protein
MLSSAVPDSPGCESESSGNETNNPDASNTGRTTLLWYIITTHWSRLQDLN